MDGTRRAEVQAEHANAMRLDECDMEHEQWDVAASVPKQDVAGERNEILN